MIRYLKQRNANDCGPIAIINVLKTLGRDFTYRDLFTIYRKCKYNHKIGTYNHDLTIALRSLKLKFVRRIDLSLDSVPLILSQNKFLIVMIRHLPKEKNNDYHYMLIIDYNKSREKYRVVNYYRSSEWLSASHIEKLFAAAGKVEAWIFKKPA